MKSTPSRDSRRRRADKPPRRENAADRDGSPLATWRKVDLHLHTPASVDYQEPGVTALDILRCADERGLDMIAFTDHNSVRGFANLWREIEDLELLEYLKRLEPAEAERLAEYRRLLGKMLLLPGFEFTATFGFHILAIFPEGTTIRLLEHLLMLLGVPEDRLGSGEVGATTDVLRTYEILSDHGALVIGAHVNSTHGIAMQGLRFGGQTKIAYTQDAHLHALEVTDLDTPGNRRSTARFFNGTKTEYPRRMHCIQGSDAHRLLRDPARETNLGVGDRPTEMLLSEVSFAGLKAALLGDDFGVTRPYHPEAPSLDLLRHAREEGNTLTQAFHENLSTKRTGMTLVLRDVVAMANSEGGTVFAGASSFAKRPIAGIANPESAIVDLEGAAARQITPSLPISIDTLATGEREVLAIHVPRGPDKPYALDAGTIFVRHEGESVAARRDEIVAMVRETTVHLPTDQALVNPALASPIAGNGTTVIGGVRPSVPGDFADRQPASAPESADGASRRRTRRGRRGQAGGTREPTDAFTAPTLASTRPQPVVEDAPPDDIAPTTGVELLQMFEQEGIAYYSLHDLQDMTYVHNVTRDVDRRVWRDAIIDREERELDEREVRWQSDYGVWRAYKPRWGERRFNLVYRGDGDLRVFYGVTEDGLVGAWHDLVVDLDR